MSIPERLDILSAFIIQSYSFDKLILPLRQAQGTASTSPGDGVDWTYGVDWA